MWLRVLQFPLVRMVLVGAADLRKRAAEADAKLMRLYEAIENGIADLSGPLLKDRLQELKARRPDSPRRKEGRGGD